MKSQAQTADPYAAAWQKVRSRMSKMTDGEKRQTLVSAGILTEKGNVKKPYKGVFVKTKAAK